MFSKEVSTLLNFCPAAGTSKIKAGPLPLAWVMQKVKEIRHFVRLSCEEFEEELLALLRPLK